MSTPGNKDTQKFVKGFKAEDFNQSSRVSDYARFFALQEFIKPPEAMDSLIKPDMNDLCRLHWLLLRRKVVSALEFGSGYSSAVMAHAMKILEAEFRDSVPKNLRVDRAFHIYSVDESEEYMRISQERIGGDLGRFVTFSSSTVELGSFEGRFATFYRELPNVSPDFIYLDGPSPDAAKDVIDGFSMAKPFRVPMSADILRFEFFLEPGTLVLVDGRTANARFLKANLRRRWIYHHDALGDVHFFELQEEPLGRINKARLDFCLEGEWLLG